MFRPSMLSTLRAAAGVCKRSIAVGAKIPELQGLKLLAGKEASDASTKEIFGGSKVVLFGVPGAYTPVCSSKHVPSFINNADQLKAQGVDKIICLSVNDKFVMENWGEKLQVADKVMLLADVDGNLTRALDQEVDLTAAGLGKRSHRFAMVVEDGVVKHVFTEASPADLTETSAEEILAVLKKA